METKAMEIPLIPSEKNFNLSKIKIDPKGGVKAEYQITASVEGEPSVIDRTESCDRDVHPDLLGLFEDLRSIVGRVFGMTSFLTLLESDEMKLPASKTMAARSFADELLQKIEVRGVSWSGSDENAGVVITAVFETTNGLKTCINTPRIKLAQISFGFEEQLETIVDAIKSETYKYLFEGKQAQLSLFGPSGEPAEEPAAVADMPEDM